MGTGKYSNLMPSSNSFCHFSSKRCVVSLLCHFMCCCVAQSLPSKFNGENNVRYVRCRNSFILLIIFFANVSGTFFAVCCRNSKIMSCIFLLVSTRNPFATSSQLVSFWKTSISLDSFSSTRRSSSKRNSGIDDYNSLRLGNVENYKEWSSTMSRKTTFGWLSPIIPNHNNHFLSLLCRRFVCCEPVRSNNQYVVVARYVLYTIRMNNRESFIVTHFFLPSPPRHT